METTDLSGEIWKQAVSTRFGDLVKDVEVSNMGRVRKITSKKLYKLGNKDNYRCIRKQNKTVYIHTLVAETYLEKRPEGLCIDHINGNKYDNRSCNLRFVSHGYNSTKQDRQEVVNENGEVAYVKIPRHWRENLQRGVESNREKLKKVDEDLVKLWDALERLTAVVNLKI